MKCFPLLQVNNTPLGFHFTTILSPNNDEPAVTWQTPYISSLDCSGKGFVSVMIDDGPVEGTGTAESLLQL
jgi:hypothetical protein